MAPDALKIRFWAPAAKVVHFYYTPISSLSISSSWGSPGLFGSPDGTDGPRWLVELCFVLCVVCFVFCALCCAVCVCCVLCVRLCSVCVVVFDAHVFVLLLLAIALRRFPLLIAASVLPAFEQENLYHALQKCLEL